MNSKYKDKSGKYVDEVSYFDVTFFGKIGATIREYVFRGDPLLIEGHLKQERWEKEGVKHSRVKLIGETMQLMGSKKGSDGAGKSSQSKSSEPEQSSGNDDSFDRANTNPSGDDVPF